MVNIAYSRYAILASLVGAFRRVHEIWMRTSRQAPTLVCRSWLHDMLLKIAYNASVGSSKNGF